TDRFSVYNAGIGGGKQPLQYLKLIYLDLLGFKPDIVINIDGYNEISMSLTENLLLDNPPIFPRAFSAYVDSNGSLLRSCTVTSDQNINKDSYLPIIQTLYYVYARRCWDNLQKITKPWWSGMLPVGSIDDYAHKTANIWSTSSNKINNFLSSKNILYLHVIQPNQYVENSKPFSEDERLYYLDNALYGNITKKYYPLLSINYLEARDVFDARNIFKNERRTVYRDNCCHLNALGNEILLSEIFEKFSDKFKSKLSEK
ncbi:MAG TPA: hypothetical protein DCZ80_00875, partial [Legionellales bacterium]|nr:hypothetical protein [Legionellales bacterium]